MKKTFLAICLLLAISSLAAQAPNKQELRKEFTRVQTEEIIKELALNEEEAAKFREQYTAYHLELSTLGSKKLYKKADTALTDEEAQKQIEHNFERAAKIQSIKEKYYQKFSEYLTANEILKMYEVEREVRQKVIAKQHQQRQQHQEKMKLQSVPKK